MKKKLLIIFLIGVFIILLIPQKWHDLNGESVLYRAILYSVTDYHAIKPEGGFYTGIEVEILGMTVYDNTNFDE